MLSGHEKSDHDVSNFVILEGATAAVLLIHERRDHVRFLQLNKYRKFPEHDIHGPITYGKTGFTTLADDVNVEAADLLVGDVTLAVAGQGERREEPVHGSETAVKVGENLSVVSRDVFPNFLALECPCSSQDGDLRHDIQNVVGAPFVDVIHLENTEVVLLLHELEDLVFNHGHIGAEVLSAETELDEFLLFHEELVRAVIHDILAENRGSQVLEKTRSDGRFTRKASDSRCKRPLHKDRCACLPTRSCSLLHRE